jgi:hypothetical protein
MLRQLISQAINVSEAKLLKPKRSLRISAFAVISFCFLSSCSGDSADASLSASGKAIDGYLKNATVFFDLNGNGTLDSNEPSATTNENGAFTINTTKSIAEANPIVVLVVSGTTIDMDSPNSPVSASYSLAAPVGAYTNVTPLTTLVASYMTSGVTLEQAVARVKSDLGIGSEDILADYISKKQSDSSYSQLHNLASATVSVLEDVTSNGAGLSLAGRLSQVKSRAETVIVPAATQIKSATSPAASKTLASSLVTANSCDGLCVKLIAK